MSRGDQVVAGLVALGPGDVLEVEAPGRPLAHEPALQIGERGHDRVDLAGGDGVRELLGVTWARSWRAAWAPLGSVMAQDGKPTCDHGGPWSGALLGRAVASLGGRSTPLARASSRYCSAASALTFSAGAISRHQVDAGPLVHRALGGGQRGVPVAGGEVPHDLGHLVHVARLQLLLVVLEAAGPVGGHAGIGLATAPTPGPRARRPRPAAARRPPRSCRAAPRASSRR